MMSVHEHLPKPIRFVNSIYRHKLPHLFATKSHANWGRS